jgi:uncharacterized protein (TIGR00661 family)
MRILYGVVGEGMGHAIRSRVVLEHLVAQGHEVEILASGRAVAFLREHFDGVHQIHGFRIVTRDQKVRRNATFWANLIDGAVALPEQIKTYFEVLERFRPEAVISDFETFAYLFAKTRRLPVFSIDNMQIIHRAEHPKAILEGLRADFEVARALVQAKLPRCDHYLITTFFRPTLRKERTSLYPPILRPEILGAEATDGQHLLVYQTVDGGGALLEALRGSGLECRIYGLRRDLKEETFEGNLRFRPFSERTFVEDLASCRAVIASAGFTLMGEAVYLHKPMLAVPLARQFEQLMNARYLAHLGYGQHAPDLRDPDTIHGFLREIPRFAEALSTYRQDGNRELLEAVDHHLDRAAAGLY